MNGVGDGTIDQRGRLWWNLARWALGLVAVAGTVVMLVLLPTGELWERFGAGVVVTCVSAAGAFAANNRYREARFARAHTAVGTVVRVHEGLTDSDSPNFVMFWVEAALADGTVLHRRLEAFSWPDPQSWVGRQIPFRHRTLKPDARNDAFFGPDERKATLGPGA